MLTAIQGLIFQKQLNCLLFSLLPLSVVCHRCVPSQWALEPIPCSFATSQWAAAAPRHQKTSQFAYENPETTDSQPKRSLSTLTQSQSSSRDPLQ